MSETEKKPNVPRQRSFVERTLKNCISCCVIPILVPAGLLGIKYIIDGKLLSEMKNQPVVTSIIGEPPDVAGIENELERDAEVIQNEIADLTTQINDQNVLLEQLERDAISNRDQITDLKTQIAANIRTLAFLTAENDRLTQDLAVLRAENNGLAIQITAEQAEQFRNNPSMVDSSLADDHQFISPATGNEITQPGNYYVVIGHLNAANEFTAQPFKVCGVEFQINYIQLQNSAYTFGGPFAEQEFYDGQTTHDMYTADLATAISVQKMEFVAESQMPGAVAPDDYDSSFARNAVIAQITVNARNFRTSPSECAAPQ